MEQKPCCGCSILSQADTKNHRSMRWGRWTASLLSWGLPVTLLALMPKCPMCVAVYVALFTGIGLSFSMASWLRVGLLVISVLSLAYLVMGVVRRKWMSHRQRLA